MQTEPEPSAPRQAAEEPAPYSAGHGRRLERCEAELVLARDEVGALSNAISHDLRSPLHIIGGFAELLARHSAGALDEKGLHYLKRISTAAAQIGLVIDEALALSRVSVCEINLVATNLETLVRKVVHELDAGKGERRVIWLIGRLPTVQADPDLLREALASLASNAFRFTSAREVARIQIGVQAGEGEMVFFVRDNGARLDVRHRERLFNTVPRLPGSAEPKSGSMSLAYLRRIIQRHGGRLWTEAVPDGGATFYFSLPGELAEAPCAPAHP